MIIIGSDNGLSRVRRQVITRDNADLLSIRPLKTKLALNYNDSRTCIRICRLQDGGHF